MNRRRYAAQPNMMPKRVYTCAYASVRFMAPNLDPMFITKTLRLPPDRQFRRGEPRFRRSKKGKVYELPKCKYGLWAMSSKQWVDSPRLETHLRWLLDELEPRADTIRALTIDELELDFFCFSAGTSPSPPSIPRSIIERSKLLGIKVKIDHYDTTGDEKPA